MSAKPGHPALRQRIAEALTRALAETSASAVGRLVGHSASTIIRRQDDLTVWPAADILAIAAEVPALRTAVIAYLSGDVPPAGQPVALVSDMVREIGLAAAVSSTISAALDDGKVTRQEAEDTLIAIQERRAHEDARLIPDLEAVVRGAQ